MDVMEIACPIATKRGGVPGNSNPKTWSGVELYTISAG